VDNACVGNEGVEPPECLGDGRDRVVRRLFLRYIAFDQADPAGVARIGALEAGARQVDHADAPVIVEKVARNGAPDAVSGAGDECDFRFGICHGCVTSSVGGIS